MESTRHVPRVTLRQWRMLHAVVECGGFAPAAKCLHLSQSAISHAIKTMQENLGVPILDVDGRRTRLTAAGHAVHARALHLIKEAVTTEELAQRVAQGWEPEIRVAVDHAFPSDILLNALHAFAQLHGSSRVLLSEMAAPDVVEALREGNTELAIGRRIPPGFLGDPLIEIEYIAVTRPGRTMLVNEGMELTAIDLECETQIVMDRAGRKVDGPGHWGAGGGRWHVSSLDTAIAAVRDGLGFAWLPRHRIEPWLEDKTLIPLPLSEGRSNKVILNLIVAPIRSAGLGVNNMAKILRTVAAESRLTPA
ncbi:MAG: LysR family transcriptional regulator [Betaproteobacteria bacterium]|nr:LysR family transcriptional regulator [Betaproteobacteria bacterium]